MDLSAVFLAFGLFFLFYTVMWDERLTTVEADRTMMETGIRRENRKEYVDMIAAVFILQGYLDYLSHQKESQEN